MTTRPKSNYLLTVTLTTQAPVRIRTEDWPIVAYAGERSSAWITVRRHRDGRSIVSAVNKAVDPADPGFVLRGGYALEPGIPIEEFIQSAVADARMDPVLAQQAIASLPPVDLETEEKAVVLTDPERALIAGLLQDAGYPNLAKHVVGTLP